MPSWAAIASKNTPASPAAKAPASPKALDSPVPATPEPTKAPEPAAAPEKPEGLDVAAIDAMPQEERTAVLGNFLYPRIAEHTQFHDAGKLTGMLLELPTAEIVRCLEAPEALAEAVDSAVAVLPAPEVATPVAKKTLSLDVDSPNCIMSVRSMESWADADEEDEDEVLPAVGDMLKIAGARRAPMPTPYHLVSDDLRSPRAQR